MKTTVDIPDELLKAAMRFTGEKTIRGTVINVLNWYNQRARQRDILKHLGTLDGFLSPEALAEGREESHETHRQQFVDRSAPKSGKSIRAIARRKSA